MIRARSLLPAGSWDAATAADRVVLPHDGRYRRRIAMRGENDVAFLLDLDEATRLRDGDGLALEDGRVVAVVAAEEPVAEIVAQDAHHLARLAWHLGNRHVPAELLADRIRIARDGVLEEMARGLGATVEVVEAAFEPEGGAYEAAEAHGHHDHDHGHHHHEHGEACGCGHDHSHDHDHHGHDHYAHERDVLHVHGQEHDHKHEHAHAHEHHGHEHKHGEACGCGHDHSHDHAQHDHDHSHDHDHHGHGHDHRHG
ncbi:UreE urease accessory domain protein [Ancylobacter novellus DSM 506]|uniref:Urease accessory protein UreE n=1 Tax=Ancylobacter novellus (strain ATCC 8093 / DSM 506 / JCM 20403 / CCM 1077 / IAM 12100 / NBRC 12443 / NCIMB 10456) TaxID=639283 RepID=D7A8Z6_ANCN5|nr:urease accessory protein UreE [Ancylobacter novellus]ADH88701.1 UreE urease accessory domain protein [Ancylobacter novellus DSM 506]